MKSERGFTLPELLVTTFVLLLAFIAAFGVLRPANYLLENQNSQRRNDIARLAVALKKYRADTGAWPADIPTQPTNIATLEDTYDLCRVLVPDYLKDMPLDPTMGTKSSASVSLAGDGSNGIETNEPCTGDDVGYSSGYTIVRSKDDSLKIEATNIFDDTMFSVVIRP